MRLSADSAHVGVPDFFYAALQCSRCGLQFIRPQPGAAILEKLYDEGFYSESKREDLISKIFARYEGLCYWDRFRLLQQRTVGCKLLDVGSGNGHFLAFMQRKGWQVSGVEWSGAGVAVTRRQFGIEVFHGALEEAAFAPSQFDAVTLWHVLEHIADPLATLREIHRLLRPGGIIVVSVPNVESVEALCLGERWALFDLPRHLYGFSPRTLRPLFEAANLDAIRIEHFSLEYSVPIAVLGLLNVVTEHNFVYNLVKKRKALPSARSSRAFRNVCLAAALAPFALLAGSGIAVLSWFLRRGTSIAVIGRKRELESGPESSG